MIRMTDEKWGFLRETSDKAGKAGIDKATGLHRTGLEDYLSVIYPTTIDWIHDKAIGKINGEGKYYRIRPDYRSESLKQIVEFDGLQHYQNPDIIEKDAYNTNLYECFGYKVVRIPYFIQLTSKAVKTLFNIDISENLFNENIPSLSVIGRNSPAYLCPAGIKRMAEEFRKFSEQYKTNIEALKQQNNTLKSGVDLLEKAYNNSNIRV
ncbi:MAG: DUF559 domain-containing protein [Bacteroidales bacterium]